ncbi:MAG: hypothetical protein JW910_22520, partial [Anaerolineae bacterium]|nr:hypothetical protein [Anaerolineae bacterium]
FAASEHLMDARIPAPFVALNAADAAQLSIAGGDLVVINAGGGTVSATAIVDDYAPAGVALLPLRLSDEPMPCQPVVGTVEKVIEPATEAAPV